jgi:hypothetical protein
LGLFLGLSVLLSPLRAAEPAGPDVAAAEKSANNDKKAGGEGEASKPSPTPAPVLDKPLDGYYDIKVLRASSRTSHYHYELKDVLQTIDKGCAWKIMISCSIEFGSPSGPAELAGEELAIREQIQQILDGCQPSELMLGAGKRRLKEDLIAALNRRLKTAAVRQLYWTDFRIVR